ncbi:MAG: MFS transporter [Solirubrobacteraceae bacterium]
MGDAGAPSRRSSRSWSRRAIAPRRSRWDPSIRTWLERSGRHSAARWIQYPLAAGNADAYLGLVAELRRLRRRTGATRWRLYRDAEDPTLFTETFLVGSWQEHERQHATIQHADREVIERIEVLLRAGRSRTVHHAQRHTASSRARRTLKTSFHQRPSSARPAGPTPAERLDQ